MHAGRKSLHHRDGPSGATDSSGEVEVYFITVCCLNRELNQLAHPEVWDTLVETVRRREREQLLRCRLLLAMPDHLHGLFSFYDASPMSVVMGDIKRWMQRQHKIVWQKNFWDHRLRNHESSVEKANYIRMNPVRAGLVTTPDAWPYVTQ